MEQVELVKHVPDKKKGKRKRTQSGDAVLSGKPKASPQKSSPIEEHSFKDGKLDVSLTQDDDGLNPCAKKKKKRSKMETKISSSTSSGNANLNDLETPQNDGDLSRSQKKRRREERKMHKQKLSCWEAKTEADNDLQVDSLVGNDLAKPSSITPLKINVKNPNFDEGISSPKVSCSTSISNARLKDLETSKNDREVDCSQESERRKKQKGKKKGKQKQKQKDEKYNGTENKDIYSDIQENDHRPILTAGQVKQDINLAPDVNLVLESTKKDNRMQPANTIIYHRRKRKSSSSVTNSFEPVTVDDSGFQMQIAQASSVEGTSFNCSDEATETQVRNDALVEAASLACSNGKLASLEKNIKEDSYAQEIIMLNAEEHNEEAYCGQILISADDGTPAAEMLDESISCKEGDISKPTGCCPSGKLLDQTDMNVERNIEEISSSSTHMLPMKGVVDQAGIDDKEKCLHESYFLLGRAIQSRKKLLILDVNGLLADIVLYYPDGYTPHTTISGKAVFKRPFCEEFLQFCFQKFNVGVWSSRTKRNVDRVLEFLMGDCVQNLLFCWDQSHCTKTRFCTVEDMEKPLMLKELKKLWEKLEPGLSWKQGEYNESNTLLLDDSPYKALRNPAHTAVFPHSYEFKAVKDKSLGPGGNIRVYLEGLAEAENVQRYVQQNPFGQRPITKSNLSWKYYQKIIEADYAEGR